MSAYAQSAVSRNEGESDVNKDEVLLSLQSFMSMKKMECDMNGREFDVATAIEAATPIVESLLYTLSTNGKLEGGTDAPNLDAFDEVAECVRDAKQYIRTDNTVEPGYEWALNSAAICMVDAFERAVAMFEDHAGDEDEDDEDLPVKASAAALSVDDIFNKMLGGKP